MSKTLMTPKERTAFMMRFSAVLFAIIVVFCVLSMCALAADDATAAIEGGVQNATFRLYNVMTAIVVPCAVVLFAWAALKVFVGGERGMEQAGKKFLTILGVLALVWLAPLIITQVSGWFNSSNASGMSQISGWGQYVNSSTGS